MIKIDVVIDLSFGDTGKGKVVNHLITQKPYTHCLRYSGGANAGHTIYLNGKKVITHMVPSGVLHGITGYIGSNCLIQPESLIKEIADLESQGFPCKNLIKISPEAFVVTSKHLTEDSQDSTIGTTKRGIGPAARDKYARTGIQAKDVELLKPFLSDFYEEFYSKEAIILAEGAQGFYLDLHYGDYPYVTSSHCSIGSVLLNGFNHQSIDRIYGTAKAYDTYVGLKKFQPDDEVFLKIRELGQEYGATTGRPRQTNWLNLDNLIKAIRVTGVHDLIISKMDVLNSLQKWALIHNSIIIEFASEDLFKGYIINNIYSGKCPTIQNIIFSSNPNDLD